MTDSELKIKALSKFQIQIAIDRLTRFKFTEEKYLRVFKEIILSNLILPRLKKSKLETLNYQTITEFAQAILNFSIEKNGVNLCGDFSINEKLKEYEISTFKQDRKSVILLDNKIEYKSAIKLFGAKVPINLKWLKSLSDSDLSATTRIKNSLLYPLEKIVIAEGITEEILLPKFAKNYGLDFEKAGIYMISAGGKNQVVRLFYKLADVLKLPIFVLLDNDAQENYSEILPKLRTFDKVHVLKIGEFEDALPHTLILRSLNNYFKNFAQVNAQELEQNLPMTKILEEIYKEKGFFEFKKSEFAHLISENLTTADFSSEISQVIDELKA